MSGQVESIVMRCLNTNNPCGTDTMPKGCHCLCKNCMAWLDESQDHLDPELQQLLYDNINDLYA